MRGYTMKPMDMAEYERAMKEQMTGHETIPGGRKSPGPTVETSCPYTETPQRKPYLPVADIREPTLEEGVSYRQKL